MDVAAAGVNFMDVVARTGRAPYTSTPPWVLGVEGAGTVTAVGEGVTGFSPGETVAWVHAPGSYAEQVLVPASTAVAVPAGVDVQAAAAVMLQGLTAHAICHSTYPVRAGEIVVVHAAAGGVGLLLTQMVKMLGGIIVATTSGGTKADAARQAGADYVVGYDEFVMAAHSVGDGAGAHVVYDSVGAATFDNSLDALRIRGCMVLYGSASGPVPPVDLTRLQTAGSLSIARPTLSSYLLTREELQWRVGDLFQWIKAGQLDVTVGRTYSLADAPLAHQDLASRRTTGKLLLLP